MKIIYTILAFFICFSTFAQIAETAEEICPLLIGEKIPYIEITSAANKPASLNQIVSKRPTIL